MHYKGVMIIATTEKGEKTWTGIKSFRILSSYYNGKFYEGQAKFVYDGDLYVINVFSEGKEVDVGKIAERLLSADAK